MWPRDILRRDAADAYVVVLENHSIWRGVLCRALVLYIAACCGEMNCCGWTTYIAALASSFLWEVLATPILLRQYLPCLEILAYPLACGLRGVLRAYISVRS
jgi:hypothetical protein